MVSWQGMLCAAVCLCAAAGSLADPLEIRPYRETLLVEAPFGEEEGMFAPRSASWGRGEVGGFGPFAVGADGRIYAADTKVNRVNIFAPDGAFVESVDMQQRHHLVDDLAVCKGWIFWMRETRWGGCSIVALDPATGDTTLVEVAPSTDNADAPVWPVFGDWSLVATGESVSLFRLRVGESYPVYQNGRVLGAREREAGVKRGLNAPPAPSLAFTREKTVTTTGEETHGDIVRLAPDGRPEKILVRSGGRIYGVAPSCFLHPRLEQERPYVVVTDYEGETLARTAMPRRPLSRAIEIRRRWYLAEDCSYYELYLTEDSVCVARWSASQ